MGCLTITRLAIVALLVASCCAAGEWRRRPEEAQTDAKPRENKLRDLLSVVNNFAKDLLRMKKRFEMATFGAVKKWMTPNLKQHHMASEEEFEDELDEEILKEEYFDFDEAEKVLFRQIMKNKHKEAEPQSYAFEKKRRLQETTLDQEYVSTDETNEAKAEQEKMLDDLLIRRDSSLEPLEFRMPATKACESGSQKLFLQVTANVCNGAFVTLEEKGKADPALCFTNVAKIESCFCSFDSYGRTCSQFTGIRCSHNSYTPYDADCLAEYNKSNLRRLGYPPCRAFKSGAYDFEISLKCGPNDLNEQFASEELMKEGIKLEYLMNKANKLVYEQPAANLPAYAYIMENPDVPPTHPVQSVQKPRNGPRHQLRQLEQHLRRRPGHLREAVDGLHRSGHQAR